MSPHFWESRAQRLYPHRAWLAMATAAGVGAFVVSGFVLQPSAARLVIALCFSTIVAAWGLLCACYWFEPSKGSLRADSWLGRHLGPINAVARWWAAIFLTLFIAAGLAAPVWWMIYDK